jgi:hypothetical protein
VALAVAFCAFRASNGADFSSLPFKSDMLIIENNSEKGKLLSIGPNVSRIDGIAHRLIGDHL